MTIYQCQNCEDLFEEAMEYHVHGGPDRFGCPSCASSDVQEVKAFDPRYDTLYKKYLRGEFGGID